MKPIRLNFLYNLLLNISKVLFPFITAPYISRILEPEGVGLFNFAITYAAYFGMVALLGIPTYGTREVAKCREDKEAVTRLMSELISIAVIFTLISTIIYLISIATVHKLQSSYVIFLITGASLYLAPINIDWYFCGQEEFKYITIRSILIRAVAIATMFILVRTKKDLLIYVIINVLAGVITNIWNYAKLLRSGIRPKLVLTGLRKHMKPVVTLFASAVAISIYTVLDTLMLGFIRDDSQVAFYTCATNISKIILTAVTSFSAVAMPRISYYLEHGMKDTINEIAGKSFSMVGFLAFPAATGLCCIAPTFAPLFYGGLFDGTIIPLQIMSMVIIMIGLNNLSTCQVLIGLGRDDLFLYSVCTGAAFNFIANLLVIPRYGAIGAAATSVAAEFIILVVSMVFVYRHTFVRIHGTGDLLKSMLVPLTFIPLVAILQRYLDGWILVAAFCCSGFVLYVAIQHVMKHSSVKLFEDTVLSKVRERLSR